jgi:myo-inositol-1-phosphate synthase
MKPIRVAIVGLGNCASALIQGVSVSKAGERKLEGVTYESIGGYDPSFIDFVAAFDVDKRKVGLAMSEAIFALPNCCWKIVKSEKELSQLPKCQVLMGPVLDGVADHMLNADENEGFRISEVNAITKREAIEILTLSGVDVLINYLPVGSQLATEWWAEVCLDSGVSFCNCIPVFIASDPKWEARFIERGLPLIGDDMRSQFGASVMSQMLQELAFDRGHIVKAHIQQNFGGNTDFLNMTDKSRLASKKISKENVIRSQDAIRNVESDGFLYAGPGDYIRHYGDNKIAIFHLELEGFGGAPVTFDAKLSVQDSPNSAGVVIDAIRFLKVAKEMGISGSLRGASAFTQKTPPEQLMFSDAKAECDSLAARHFTPRTSRQVRGRAAL